MCERLECNTQQNLPKQAKKCYPIILEECENKSGYIVDVPDFGISTFGASLSEALDMARDAIGAADLSKQDHNEPIPIPTDIT